ncbi:MAG: hypothetical protein KDD55_07480 [Bdellovibrionales bacterium]|nr:hypothetical protein [Bdellovibrionales bacterium]
MLYPDSPREPYESELLFSEESLTDTAESVDSDVLQGASFPTRKSHIQESGADTSIEREPLSVSEASLCQEGEKSKSFLRKGWDWFAEAYRSKGGTLLIGLGASCVSFPLSWVIGNALQSTTFPKALGGLATMAGSMLFWDVLYSAGLYYFYDRKDLHKSGGEKTVRGQLNRYVINSLEADTGWIASYQAFYAIAAFGFGVSTATAAAIAHGISILVVDLLRPPLLKLNRTLVRDQR